MYTVSSLQWLASFARVVQMKPFRGAASKYDREGDHVAFTWWTELVVEGIHPLVVNRILASKSKVTALRC
jgi:hypothetical protein